MFVTPTLNLVEKYLRLNFHSKNEKLKADVQSKAIQLFLALFLLLLTTAVFGQTENCQTQEIHQNLMNVDPDYRLRNEQMEREIYRLTMEKQATLRSDLEVFTIPIVVHVLYETDPRRDLEEFVNEKIKALNEGFSYKNPSTLNNPFSGVDTRIQFCLAKRDPEGNFTKGIDAQQTIEYSTNNLSNNNGFKMQEIYNWDPSRYYNIYLVDELINAGGYAFYASEHGKFYDGSVVDHDSHSSTWVHELGHALYLYHIFSPNSGFSTFSWQCPSNSDCLVFGDKVCDTPPTRSVGCNIQNSCFTDEDDPRTNNPYRAISLGGLGGQNDIEDNYMGYYNSDCRWAFTRGQSERMRLTVETYRESYLRSEVLRFEATELVASPNPTSGHLDIRGPLANVNYYRVIDTAGQTVKQGRLDHCQVVNISELNAGIYILVLDNGEEIRSTKVLKF